jgi:multidrug efflux system membrane fusion protein
MRAKLQDLKMAFRIKGSHVIAIAIAAGIALWMVTGEFRLGGRSDSAENMAPIAVREAARDSALFKVRHVPLVSRLRSESILIRGRTKADSVVSIRAETAGILQERLVAKGDRVAKGDLVCRIERGVREAQLAQASAQLAQAQSEYDANSDLKKKGFASQNKLTGLAAALDAAKAGLAAAQQEIERTDIRANADGVVQDPVAEVGDMLSMGATCVTLVNTDPMLFTGQISERDIARISTGMAASVSIISGETVEGNIRYIAPSADPQTRTFMTEIEIDGHSELRDGMTAEARIALASDTAFAVSPSWITLDDDGTIGIRIVNAEDIVEFVKVQIIAQEKDGFWISGPREGDRIITLGQEYVVAGEKVITTLDDRVAAKLAELAEPVAGTQQ